MFSIQLIVLSYILALLVTNTSYFPQSDKSFQSFLLKRRNFVGNPLFFFWGVAKRFFL